MQVELGSVGGKGAGFAHDYAAGEMFFEDERVRLIEPPTVSGRILRQEGKVVVQGRVKAVAEVECDRCLKLLRLPVDTEFSLEFVTAEAYKASETAELGEEDLTLSVLEGEFIDVDEIVREQVLLAVPSQTICSESCKGLCPICGAERNVNECDCRETEIDPRWAGLRKLVNGKW